jgi:hypothetical protein
MYWIPEAKIVYSHSNNIAVDKPMKETDFFVLEGSGKLKQEDIRIVIFYCPL